MEDTARLLRKSRSPIATTTGGGTGTDQGGYHQSDTSSENSTDDEESQCGVGDSRSYNRLSSNGNIFCHSKLFKKLSFCGCMLLVCVFLYIPLSNNTHTRIVSIPGWNYNTSRVTARYILPHQNTTIIDPVNICNGDKFLLLIVICSSTNNFEARQVIRETWGNVSEFNYGYFSQIHGSPKGRYLEINSTKWEKYLLPPVSNARKHSNSSNNNSSRIDRRYSVKIVFLIGQTQDNETQLKINDESDLYSDIIQENFLDSYNNLTIKSVMMLKWVNNNCLNKVKFLMKCDDDIFLNVPNLLHILLGGTVPLYNSTVTVYDRKTIRTLAADNRIRNTNQVFLGFLFCHAKPISDVTSKWYSPIYMFSEDIYPNYLSGTGYVMSVDTVQALYNASLQTPLFHLEDIYITGICSSKIKLRPHHHPLFIYTRIQNQCALKGMITQHKFTPEEILKAYEFVVNTKKHCPPPDKTYNTNKIKPRQKSCQ